jgi:hypothetical protein
MRGHLILNKFLLVLVITSQSSLGIASRSHSLHPETGSVQTLDHSLKVDISLRTPTDTTITFRSDEEIRENNPDAPARRIPHLVLKRNGVLTPGFERTLLVSLNHLSIPRSGLFLDLTIESQHGDPDLDGKKSDKIEIWHETRFVPYASDEVQPVDFTITFGQAASPEGIAIRTPTDYYAYRLSLINPRGEKLQEIHGEYAFLLENQWRVPLPNVLEESPGAAPDQLVLYYCDMIPLQRDRRDPLSQLTRQEVDRYVQTELIPAMVHAFEVQTNLWGMPWYGEWINYRDGEDPKSLSVALSEYRRWYHGAAPILGYATISIRVDGSFGDYATLTDGILSVFHHELFHNQQRNISLHFGSNGNLSGKDEAWKMFSEGTAVLASAVGQPGVEFAPVNQPRSYVRRVRAFLGEDGLIGGGLNESYAEIPYHLAVYWRFLYEHCGGLVNGTEDPAAGMQIIRHVLEILYEGKVVDIKSSSEAAGALPKIVDRALQETSSCEFRTYQESLLRFSEAVYLLRLQNGRCTTAMEDLGCGFFDPQHLYPTPNAEIHSIPPNADTSIQSAIPSSYGIDLLELQLDAPLNHKSLGIFFESVSGTHPQAEFCMEVWQIQTRRNSSESGSVSVPVGEPRSICTEAGSAVLEIDLVNTDETTGIGIVITRVDSHEHLSAGQYSLQISSD